MCKILFVCYFSLLYLDFQHAFFVASHSCIYKIGKNEIEIVETLDLVLVDIRLAITKLLPSKNVVLRAILDKDVENFSSIII